MQQIAAHGFSDRITVHPGSAVDTLAQMTDPFDLIFNDASLDEYEDLLVHFMRLLRPGGLLVSSNLFLAQYDPDIPGLDHAIAYRRRLVEDPALRTAFTSSGLALTVWRRD